MAKNKHHQTQSDPIVETKDAKKEQPTPREYVLSKFGDFYSLMDEENTDDTIRQEIEKWVKGLQVKYGLESYQILCLINDKSIVRWDSNRIYQALNALGGKGTKDILLVLHSPGGKIEPAYLISKTCKKWSNKKFSIAVPRMAKSAATLLSLGADEIHMGQMSELGPIDLQIGDFPALGLNNALNVISQLSSQYPQSSEMWSAYLHKNLNLMHLGYFDRINNSASQYGERLLAGKKLAEGHTAESVTKHLVHHYKDHSFVIDYDECLTLFGKEMVKFETNEYKFSNELFDVVENMSFLLEYRRKKQYRWVGGLENGLLIRDIEKES